MAKTPGTQCRKPRFNPWSGNYIPHAATKTRYSQINIKKKKIRFRNLRTPSVSSPPQYLQVRGQALLHSFHTVCTLWYTLNSGRLLKVHILGKQLTNSVNLELSGDFPRGPVVKTPCFHCRGHMFKTWSGNEELTCRVVLSKEILKIKNRAF